MARSVAKLERLVQCLAEFEVLKRQIFRRWTQWLPHVGAPGAGVLSTLGAHPRAQESDRELFKVESPTRSIRATCLGPT